MFNNLRRFIDKIKPNFVKGGRFAWLQSTFEAFETFAFTPNRVTKRGCHVRDAIDLKRAMITVVIALVPAMLFGMWNIGYQTSLHATDWPYELGTVVSWWYCLWFGFLRMLPMLAVSYIVGLSIEFTFAQIRHHVVNEGFLVTGFLIPMIVPVTTPLWQLALATAFAVIIGKEVFGGTGMNFLNPALVARAFLFFAYPTRMSGDNVWIANDLWGTDAIAGATPLAELAAGLQPSASALDMFVGTIPGSTCETSVIAILLGAVLLLLTGIASWRIMLSVILGGGIMGLFFNLLAILNLPQLSTLNSQLSTYLQLPFYYHYLMGGFMFGAVFMATDPVTAAQTNIGKWIYGLLIGIFAVMLRVINPAYPEGMMLSILLMNCFAPLIDHCVVARNIKMRQKRALVKSKTAAQ